MESSPLQWPTLHTDLLLKIAKCLDTRLDVLRFRAVCSSWRSSVPLPPKTPSPYPQLKLPSLIGPNPALDAKYGGHFLLTESTIYALQPLTEISSWDTTKTWIIKITESESGKVVYENPLSSISFDCKIKKSGYDVWKNPFYSTSPDYKTLFEPKFLNLLDYRVDEITKVHGLEFVQPRKEPDLQLNDTSMVKVVATSSLYKIGDGFAVMGLHTGGKLLLWRFGDEQWNNIKDNGEHSIYQDVVYRNGNFYAIDVAGLVISINPVSMEVTELSPVNRGPNVPCGGQYKYLVKSFGNLFRVDSYYLDEIERRHSSVSDDNCPVPLIIYKLDEEKRDWVHVEDLDDEVLFVGSVGSFSVLAKKIHGLKRNCVYYDDISDSELDDSNLPGSDYGLFDLDDGTGGPLSKFPCYFKIFWPPPSWLRSNDRVI